MPKKKPVRASRTSRRLKRPRRVEPSEYWRALNEKYPDHPALKEETVYALPVRLLDSIQRHLPRFFTDEEFSFERDLAAEAGCGFFQGRRITYPPLEVDDASVKDELDLKLEQSNQQIRNMLNEQMLAQGVSKQQIQADQELAAKERAIAEKWRWAYAGWVATSADFRRERDQLRAEMVKLVGVDVLPCMPATLTGYLPAIENPELFQLLSLPFLRRWSLDSLVTWELPVPMRAELNTPNLYDYSAIRESGVVAFIPWYLLRHRRLELYAMSDMRQRQMIPPGQAEWLSGRDKNWGCERWVQILKLYVNLELVLQGRHPQKVRSRLATLDAVYVDYLRNKFGAKTLNEDSVRKLRQRLTRRLG